MGRWSTSQQLLAGGLVRHASSRNMVKFSLNDDCMLPACLSEGAPRFVCGATRLAVQTLAFQS